MLERFGLFGAGLGGIAGLGYGAYHGGVLGAAAGGVAGLILGPPVLLVATIGLTLAIGVPIFLGFMLMQEALKCCLVGGVVAAECCLR